MLWLILSWISIGVMAAQPQAIPSPKPKAKAPTAKVSSAKSLSVRTRTNPNFKNPYPRKFPQKPKPIVLTKRNPIKITPRTSATPSDFQLVESAPGKLTLSFRALNPQNALSARDPMTLQLFSTEKLKLSPYLVTKAKWNSKNQIVVSYSGAPKGKIIHVQGVAAYTLCSKNQQQCKKTKSKLVYEFKPKV